MGSLENQNPSYWDCSQEICTIYCRQYCYLIFPPPSPPPADGDSGWPPFSPVMIAVIGLLVISLLLVSYYIAVRQCCQGRNVNAGAPPRSGLDEEMIKAIEVRRYQVGDDGLTEGSKCTVCLGEFHEDEPVRVLPKCSHTFHLPCIDAWLRSQSTCPLCRTSITAFVATLTDPQNLPSIGMTLDWVRRDDDLVLVVDGHGLDCRIGPMVGDSRGR